ncbi:MAG: hypothetical protein M9952_04030 [Microthrixaceae bacterium]|nr:hypothetical protein [Microthrixaceae bacterium]MCO5312091.1 hypothetical protein [Microthrixaceae bacterium]TXI55268.1 MAG: hypothetical protein E6Q57_01070 [Mycobacterium sp.]HPB44504.1 hypothetical protein [Microthrixaceae bacterium]
MELEHVSLVDSFVLSIESDESYVAFELDAALETAHERFYEPPRPGENGAYAHLRWCLRGEVWWNEGPHLDRPAIGADGERDFGGIDVWFSEGDVDHLEGEWGEVAVRGAVQTVEYLSP